MTERTRTLSRSESIAVLRRGGIHQDVINAVMADLPDVIDLDRDRPVYERHGITLGRLLENLGDSP